LKFPDGVRCGVEFELEYGNRREFAELVDAGWQYKRDGSLNESGCEFITPPSYGPGTLGRIYNCYSILRSSGWRTSERTGLHVHFSFSDYSWNTRRLVRLARLWNAWVQMLYLMQTHNRIACGYCNPNVVQLPAFIKHRNRVKDGVGTRTHDNVAARELFGYDRYLGLNVTCALQAHGTIEFRLAEGMDSPDDAVRWIALLAWLVKAIDNEPDMRWVRKAYESDCAWSECDMSNRTGYAIRALNMPDQTTTESLAAFTRQRISAGMSARSITSGRLYNTIFMPPNRILQSYIKDPSRTVAMMIWARSMNPQIYNDILSPSDPTNSQLELFLTGYVRGLQRTAQYESAPTGNVIDPDMCEILLKNRQYLIPFMKPEWDTTNVYQHTWDRYYRAIRTSDRFGIPIHNPVGFRMEVPCVV